MLYGRFAVRGANEGEVTVITRRTASRRALALIAASFLAAGLAACASGSAGIDTVNMPKSSGTNVNAASGSNELVMESSPENSITQNFNPFVTSAAPEGMGATGLVYEPLIQFDLADPARQYNWLATNVSWGNSGKSITFTIRQNVKWNDGTPLTVNDAAFTFNYVKKHSSGADNINLGNLQIQSVSDDPAHNTVTVNFATPQYMKLEQIAGQAILPEKEWSKIGNPATYTDPDPVGTGPYVLGAFTPQGFTMVKNKYYWQPVPVSRVFFPVYASNTNALTALFSGQIDWTGNYIPNLDTDFVATDKANHHYWEAAGSSNALWPNLSAWPTSQLAVRQAIDVAINRTALGKQGESGLEDPLLNASGITLPTFKNWLADDVKDMTVPANGDAAAAGAILRKAGYAKDGNGYWALNGREVKLTIVDPSSYTDYVQSATLIAGDLQKAGINATFSGLTVNAWNADMTSGNFQLALHWGSNGITPYNLYDNWLDKNLIGGGTGNFERLNDPEIQTALQKLANDQFPEEQTADLAPIEKYVATQLPVIPTTTAADWFEYNSQRFVGWPSIDDPYESGQPSGNNNGPGTGSDEVVLLRLKPAS